MSFCRAKKSQISMVLETLMDFCNASGLKVNFVKSKTMCSSHIQRSKKDHLSSFSNIRIVEDLGYYLGFPIVEGRVSKNTYKFVAEKIQKRMASWKKRLLNKAGKVCLAKSVTSSIPIYPMQTHFLPRSVCNQIDSLTRQFIWGKKGSTRSRNLINWEVLTLPIDVGGLGMQDTRATNLSLLGKLIWSIFHEKNKLWIQVITHKYLGNNSIWAASKNNTTSLTWKIIMKAVEALKDGFAISLNVVNSNLWFYDWTG